MTRILLLVAALAVLLDVHAATTITEKADSGWQLMRGTTNVGTPHASLDACKTAARADAESRKASADYRCRQSDYFRVTYSADPTVPPPTTWTLCATDPGYCTVPPGTTIRFGVSATDRYLDSPNRSGTVWCDISSFGGTATDPAPGVRKSCYVPSGIVTPPPPDVCPNLSGDQATVPAGMVKDAAGNCVTAPPPPSGTAAGPRVSSFTPSGPIVATAGQVISGLSISNPGGDCVVIRAPGVVIRDSKIGPCGRAAVLIEGTRDATVEHISVTDAGMGVWAVSASNVTVRNSVFNTLRRIGEKYAHAVEMTRINGGVVDGNEFIGSFPNDVLSGYESSNMRYTRNLFDISQLDEPTGAAFTMGDSTTGKPGSNNYVAYNVVRRQVGGVPAGVFGSEGNTVLEFNCFTAGIQAYNYSGVFVGVTVRNNVINMANSFVPDPGAIAGWDTNVNATDCSKVPR